MQLLPINTVKNLDDIDDLMSRSSIISNATYTGETIEYVNFLFSLRKYTEKQIAQLVLFRNEDDDETCDVLITPEMLYDLIGNNISVDHFMDIIKRCEIDCGYIYNQISETDCRVKIYLENASPPVLSSEEKSWYTLNIKSLPRVLGTFKPENDEIRNMFRATSLCFLLFEKRNKKRKLLGDLERLNRDINRLELVLQL